MEKAQAWLVNISNKILAGLRETNHVAGVEPWSVEIHLQANEVLCGQATKDVQLVAFS